jgi:hypothetical protein
MVAWFYVYVQHVLPTLTRRGEPAVWAMRKSEMQAQLGAYGRICAEDGLGLARCRFMVVGFRLMQVVGWVMLAVWVWGVFGGIVMRLVRAGRA